MHSVFCTALLGTKGFFVRVMVEVQSPPLNDASAHIAAPTNTLMDTLFLLLPVLLPHPRDTYGFFYATRPKNVLSFAGSIPRVFQGFHFIAVIVTLFLFIQCGWETIMFMGQSHVQFHVMFQDPSKVHLLENIPYNATRHYSEFVGKLSLLLFSWRILGQLSKCCTHSRPIRRSSYGPLA